MAQAGMHALVGAAVRKVLPEREWAMLGVILGSMFPDMDNYLVAVATLTKQSTEGLHRTFTHSFFTILAVVVLFWAIGQASKRPRWTTLGLGLGLGIALHIALDLALWFNGVELLWPFGGWVNFWEGYTPPSWLMHLQDPLEFLFFGLFFIWLYRAAQKHGTDTAFLGALRGWIIAMGVLLVVFLPLVLSDPPGLMTIIYGALYLVSLTAAAVIAIRMRATLEA